MKILVVNCGSSSLKFQLIDAETEELTAKGLCERIGIAGSQISYTLAGHEKRRWEAPMANHKDAVRLMLKTLTDPETGAVKELSEIGAVGHRVVHGGEHFSKATLIDRKVKEAIMECTVLAPLHNPANLQGIEDCELLMPGVPQVAVFDTAFHQTMEEDAYLYAVPYRYYKQYGIRRYGFHGTSHEYVSRRAAALLGRPGGELKLIVCHLGNGASVSAIKNGKCVDTSMGLTPLEGLIMGTRSGDVDPGVMEMIAGKDGKNIHEVVRILNKESGVLGLSDGFSSDFRDLEDAYLAGDNPAATRAIRAFVLRVAKYIGAYAAELNGVDAVCFTAGIGENSPVIRELVCEYLGYLGVELDREQNRVRGKERDVTTPASKTRVLVIPTNEELEIARHTRELVQG
ncbi:MAG: acetate kinase [Eubacteriales bacterium]|nr:acetate kinase [Eubacteriales bacterium]